MIILQQNDVRFNHGIDKNALAERGVSENRQGENALAEKGISNPIPPMFQKSLGGTNYKVYIHFSQSSKEKFEDKILRLLTYAPELVQTTERRQI